MRVLHINSDYLWTTLHQLMIISLTKIGINNTVYSAVSNKNEACITLKENEIVDICFKKRDRYFFWYKQKKKIDSLQKKIHVQDYNIIHAYYLFTDGYCARELSKKYNIPYVVAVRNTDVNLYFSKMFFFRKIGVNVLLDAEKIFFLSVTYRDFLIKKYIPSRFQDLIFKKSIIIPNGIDEFWFQNIFEDRDYVDFKERLKNKNVKLIYVGTVDKNKNIGLIIDALKQLKQTGWCATLFVIGAILDEKEFALFKNNDDVTYIEKQPKELLLNFYRSADIFVMPSHHETFGLVYAEAMSQGLPVIYTREQGFDKQFEEGVVGYSVNDMDAEELAEKIEMICDKYQTISRNCLEKVNKFRWGSIAKVYSNIYERIMEP